VSFNVGGLYVSIKKGVDVAAVAKAITEVWTARGAKVDTKGDPRKLDSLGLEKSKRIGYAISEAGGWIVVAESEQYFFDHGVAAHVAKQLNTECLWYGLFGATDGGVFERITKKSERVYGYGEVEEIVGELPMPFTYYTELPADDDITYVAFTKAADAKYVHGPIEEEDEGPADPPAKAPKRTKGTAKAPFAPVRVKHDKELLIRDGFMLAWFLRGSIGKTRKAIASALERYIAFVPPDMLRWSLLGSNSTTVRAFNASTVSRAQGMLAKSDVYFWLGSDDAPETGKPQKAEPNCPAYLFHLNADSDPTGTLEMRFASDFVWQVGVDAIVEFATEVTSELPIVSGYGSLELAMHPMVMSLSSRQHEAAMPIAIAHPGYDLASNDSTNHLLGAHARGARWLTMLGPDLAPKVKSGLAKTGAELIAAGKNLIVRAGAEPHPDPDPKLLGKVAKALLPVTLLDDGFVGAWFEDPKTGERDPAAYAAWEFRFMGGLAGAIAYLDAQKDRDSKRRLLLIRIEQGDYAAATKALAVATKAGWKDQHLGSELLALSKLAEAANKQADALAWLLRFRDSNKSNDYALWALGELHQRLGNKAEAAASFAAYKKRRGQN
jgi:hypothetical protein